MINVKYWYQILKNPIALWKLNKKVQLSSFTNCYHDIIKKENADVVYNTENQSIVIERGSAEFFPEWFRMLYGTAEFK